MKIETVLFGGGVFIFAPIAAVYGFITHFQEPVGFSALILTSLLALMIGGYFLYVSGTIDPRPEDDPDGEISQAAGVQGVFSPYSWWPLAVAGAAAVIFLGLAVGVWLALIGVGLTAVAILGWVFEYYRGEHAH